MNNILLSDEQKEIVDKAQSKSLITNDYLYDSLNENLKIISELFFDGKIERAKKFNVGSNVFKTVSDTYSFFTGSPQTAFEFESQKFVADFISLSQMVVGLERIDGKLTPYYIDAEDYIFSDNTHKVIKYYEKLEKSKKVTYMLVQKFFPGYTENKLYKLPSLLSTGGDEVDLGTIEQTSNLSEIVETGLDVPAIIVYSERDITKVNQSEIDKIKNLGYSLDRKQVLFETQFLQETDQYILYENILFPESAKDENGTIVSSKIGKKLQNNNQIGEKADIKFISNKNDLIKDAIEYEQKQLSKVTAATGVPLDFLGLNSTGTTSGSSRTLMMGAFVKKIQSIRNRIDVILLNILKLGGYDNIEIIWDDIIPKSDEALANELKIAREAGFVSQYTSIKKYLHLDTEEEIKTEIDRINLENNILTNE